LVDGHIPRRLHGRLSKWQILRCAEQVFMIAVSELSHLLDDFGIVAIHVWNSISASLWKGWSVPTGKHDL
jgi:hypothetical protein